MLTLSVKSTRKWLSSFPPLKGVYYGILFVIRVIRNRCLLTPIDRKAPFLGPLAKTGVYYKKVSEDVLDAMKDKFQDSGCDGNLHIIWEVSDSILLRDLFDFLTPTVRDYLGPESYLDGMNWNVSVRNDNSISSHWHTDNVGNRLRVFCCIEGDGSQPTQVVTSNDRIPKFATWIRYSIIELCRWVGFGVRTISSRGLVSCDHKTGDMYIFDTQLLHRGTYETGEARRVVLQIDFSNPAKHVIARGPIGTDELNTFQFDERLLEVTSFREIIDNQRIRYLDSGACEYAML